MKIIIPNKRAVQYRANRVGFRAHSAVICHLAAGFGTEIGHQMVKNSEKFRKIRKNLEKIANSSRMNRKPMNEATMPDRRRITREGKNSKTWQQRHSTKACRHDAMARKKNWLHVTVRTIRVIRKSSSFLSLKICRRTGKKTQGH